MKFAYFWFLFSFRVIGGVPLVKPGRLQKQRQKNFRYDVTVLLCRFKTNAPTLLHYLFGCLEYVRYRRRRWSIFLYTLGDVLASIIAVFLKSCPWAMGNPQGVHMYKKGSINICSHACQRAKSLSEYESVTKFFILNYNLRAALYRLVYVFLAKVLDDPCILKVERSWSC